jgi:hypothetical protein
MIYLIITTSTVINKHTVENYETRKQNYINAIRHTLSFCNKSKITPIIVENNDNINQDKYLNGFNENILYTNNNLKLDTVIHKGVIELYDIKDVIENFKIKDDDIIIKLSGRYILNSSQFLDYVYDNQNKYDAFVKFYNVCTHKFEEYDSALGMFALRCKYLKEFNYDTNKSPEVDFATYIRNLKEKKIRLKEIEKLDLICVFAQSLYMSHI